MSGALLMATETMILDGSQELDGRLRLFGGKAADTLKGGGQADLLHGNLGADTLAGNGGADIVPLRFDGGVELRLTMDQILDFTPGTDKIDLSRIDANSDRRPATRPSAGSAPTPSAARPGSFAPSSQGGIWIVEGDTNGDSVADLVIALTLQGPTPLGAGDFLL